LKLDCDVKTYAMSLGGEAQENFYNLIQEIVHYSNSHDNFERLRILKMLQFLDECLAAWNFGCTFENKLPAYPSRFIGSYTLWKRRVNQIQSWIKCLENFGENYKTVKGLESQEIGDHGPRSVSGNRLDEIPGEIFYQIKQKLSNGDDVDQINRACQYDWSLFDLAEDRLWKNLCFYNFKGCFDSEIRIDRPRTPGCETWRNVYFRLDKTYQKLNADCVENLELCRECNCLFWRSIGHPHIENRGQSSIIIKPIDFLLFFCK